MRTLLSMAICGLALLCGCAHNRYVHGHGDAGQFILRHAVAFGGRPVATNALSSVGTNWQYVQDEFGVGVLLPLSEYGAVEDYLTSAFGPRSNHAGWSVRDIGVAIYLQRSGSNTEVGIYPPMSEEKQARAFQEMSATIEKNTGDEKK